MRVLFFCSSGRRQTRCALVTGVQTCALPIYQPGPLTILGNVYDQPGPKQAEAVLRDRAVHPATARDVATKLARHFSGDEPPATLVDRLEKDFERTGGDLPSLYRTLVGSPEPWAAAPTMFKSPWDWTVSMLRALKTPGLGERQNRSEEHTSELQSLLR